MPKKILDAQENLKPDCAFTNAISNDICVDPICQVSATGDRRVFLYHSFDGFPDASDRDVY